MNPQADRAVAQGPFVVTPEIVGDESLEGLAKWIHRERELLAHEKRSRGALLFRQFAISSPDDFVVLLNAFGAELLHYEEGLSRRKEVREHVYPTTTYPAHLRICMHNELCHTWRQPRNLYLFCVTPPAKDGQTPITDGREILKQLNPKILDRFRGREVLYLTNMPSRESEQTFGRPWQEVYGTNERKEVEQLLESRGNRFEWQENGTLRTWSQGPVTVPHPETGDEVWFNQAPLWHVSNLGAWGQKLRRMFGEEGVPTNAFLDGGEAIPDEVILEIQDVMWDKRISFDWQVGDTAVVDNYRMLHARNSFEGERLILLAMSLV